jgi:hypothetical protein
VDDHGGDLANNYNKINNRERQMTVLLEAEKREDTEVRRQRLELGIFREPHRFKSLDYETWTNNSEEIDDRGRLIIVIAGLQKWEKTQKCVDKGMLRASFGCDPVKFKKCADAVLYIEECRVRASFDGVLDSTHTFLHKKNCRNNRRLMRALTGLPSYYQVRGWGVEILEVES